MPENGGAVASASSDNSYLPNHPGSEEVTQKTSRKTGRRSQNLVESNACACIGEHVIPFWGK
jgi:hypothetical protein